MCIFSFVYLPIVYHILPNIAMRLGRKVIDRQKIVGTHPTERLFFRRLAVEIVGTDPTERLFFRRLAVEAGEMWHREVQK
jgi:hypothetical protein